MGSNNSHNLLSKVHVDLRVTPTIIWDWISPIGFFFGMDRIFSILYVIIVLLAG